MNRLESDASEFKTRKDTDEQRYVPRLIIRRAGHRLTSDSETSRKEAGQTSDLPRQRIQETMTLDCLLSTRGRSDDVFSRPIC